jgi:hypothetical protein
LAPARGRDAAASGAKPGAESSVATMASARIKQARRGNAARGWDSRNGPFSREGGWGEQDRRYADKAPCPAAGSAAAAVGLSHRSRRSGQAPGIARLRDDASGITKAGGFGNKFHVIATMVKSCMARRRRPACSAPTRHPRRRHGQGSKPDSTGKDSPCRRSAAARRSASAPP